MAWYEILIVSVGLSLDVLTYALYKGAMLSKLDKKQILKMTLLFTGWQSGAMLLGSLISEIPYIAMNYQRTERLFRAASAVIFFLIAIWLIVRSSRMRDPVERREDVFAWKQLCVWAMLTSVDSFLSGIGMGFFRHRSNRTDHTAGDHGCVSRGYRYLCWIPDRMSREKPCADQWCDHLPVGRDRCAVPLLQLETGIFM